MAATLAGRSDRNHPSYGRRRTHSRVTAFAHGPSSLPVQGRRYPNPGDPPGPDGGRGLGGIPAVTVGIAAASAIGSAAVAAAAWADTHAARTSSSTTDSTADNTSDSTSDGTSTDAGAPSLSRTDQRPHVTSGGS